MNRTEELLDQVATFADRLAESDKLADTGSMTTAEALAELYEKREWVDEWLEQKPIKEKKAYIGGRPPQPDSRNRFSQWLVWKQEQRKKRSLRSRHTYQLLNAYEVKSYLRQAQITSERLIRPLDWLRKNRYVDRIPEVWKRAVELAGSAEAVTSTHTRQAVNEWKKDTLGTKGVKQAVRIARAAAHRGQAQQLVQQLFADGDQTEVEKFHKWYVDFLRDRQQSEAKAA
jgi:hypothetical protein